ncbi:hypothetical protein SPI_05938 [Niveomyces insectorum RCEF 264]|uniref:Uncharacterized protein n=1 Tax=Niveomyces insectorum RCEF 264 TaxID=1081102 RepID=A0A167SLT6_9HYPO|nr:hypothetical protein SPI_05938 [Niveomyces insectorum RCEF 264]
MSTTQIQPPKPRPKIKVSHLALLQHRTIFVANRLTRLAALGRAGQWILHHEDIYYPILDTRPDSRDHSKEIRICDVTYEGKPVTAGNIELVWVGSAPAPDFTSVAFWTDKLKDLETKLKQTEDALEEGRAHHGFTPDELQVLELMESRAGHFFHKAAQDRARELEQTKDEVYRILILLAGKGRPGQWILHNEDLYHPSIDTRPQTRKPGSGLVIRGFKQFGNHSPELVWDGKAPAPDLTSHIFWRRKRLRLVDEQVKVRNGLVHPNFTPEELRVLESMEGQQNHYFAECAQQRRDVSPPRPLSPSSQAAAHELASARRRVIAMMQSIWDLGLAGQWILHLEDIFCPESDTRRRCRNANNEGDDDDDGDDDTYPVSSIRDCGDFGLRYDGALPLPDFDDVAYWKKKYATLEAKREEVRTGRVEHHFTPAELATLQLAERDRETQYVPDAASQKLTGVRAWLGIEREGSNSPDGAKSTPNSAAGTFASTGLEDNEQQGISVTRKRKRRTDDSNNDDDDDDDDNNREADMPEESKRPLKRSRARQQRQHRLKRTALSTHIHSYRQAHAQNPPIRGEYATSTPSNDHEDGPSSLPKLPIVSAIRRTGRKKKGKEETARLVKKPQRVLHRARCPGNGEGNHTGLEAHAKLRRSARIAAFSDGRRLTTVAVRT